ncbi:hypothetical protein ACSMXN_20855 [Jatrophihabitans sp. DSM 45814]
MTIKTFEGLHQDQIYSILFMRHLDHAPAEIAAITQASTAQIRRVIESFEYDPATKTATLRTTAQKATGRPRLLRPDQIDTVLEMREGGESFRAIGAVLGVSGDTVRNSLKRLEDHAEDEPETGPAAEVEVPDPVTWPPPEGVNPEWRSVRVRGEGGDPRDTGMVKVRPARLWGKTVLITAEGRVYCDYCHELVTPAELATKGTRHRSIAPAFSAVQPGELLPMSGDSHAPAQVPPW